MRRLIVLLLLLGAARVCAEPLRIATWNLNSSDALALVSADDDNRLADIAAVLNELNADVILLQGVRDQPECARLANLLKPAPWRVAVCSSFTDVSGRPLPQVAILSRKSVTAAWSKPWQAEGPVTPPGGFAFARVQLGSGDAGIFSVQFKNNATSGSVEHDTQLTIREREISAAQLVQQAAALGTSPSDPPSAIVVAGSFNTNPDEPQFVSEITLRLLENAGFTNAFHGVPLEDRITRRGDGLHPDATVDYVFAKRSDFPAAPRIVASELSRQFPVVCEAIVRAAAPVPKVLASRPAAQWQPVALALMLVLFLFCWWWVLGRKRFYSPELAAVVGEDGSANLLSFPERADAFPAFPETLDELEVDGQSLPARSRSGLARSQISSLERRAAEAEQRARQATDLLRQGLVPHLARWMKDRLFRGIASQREHLLLTQQAGANQVAALEERLARVQTQMQNRFGAYERRIAELEKEVMAKDRLNRELIEAKAQLMQPELATARSREEGT